MKTRKCYGRVQLDPRPDRFQLILNMAGAFVIGAVLAAIFLQLFSL